MFLITSKLKMDTKYLQADEAYHIGPPAASESYLRQDKILNVAKLSGAQVFLLYHLIFN